jgi:hypothetical protein
VLVMSKARHRGAVVTCHMTVVGELTTHGAAAGGVTDEEACVV